jgi:gluconolactonase
MEQTTLSNGFFFPEGPSQGPDGRIYAVEMGGQVVARFGADGVREEFAKIDGAPGASAWGPDGAVYVTNSGGLAFADGRPAGPGEPNSGGSIDRVSPDGSEVVRLYTEWEGKPLGAPNDLVFDPEGNLWFTDPEHGDMFTEPVVWPKGHVFWARPDGSEIRRAATDYNLSNGIAIKNDGTTLLVAETLTSSILAHDITGPGEIGPRRLYAKLPEGHFPDGMALDVDDHLIVAAVGAGALVHFGPDGEMIERIPTEDTDVTNCCFVGEDRRTLVFTEGFKGRVSAFQWPRPGMVPYPERLRDR